jgi:hypothetical protein
MECDGSLLFKGTGFDLIMYSLFDSFVQPLVFVVLLREVYSSLCSMYHHPKFWHPLLPFWPVAFSMNGFLQVSVRGMKEYLETTNDLYLTLSQIYFLTALHFNLDWE